MTKNQKSLEPNEEQELNDLIRKNQYIVTGLKENTAWMSVIRDVTEQGKKLDDTWQYVSDAHKMAEFRITKLAIVKILNLIPDYEADIKLAQEQISKIVNVEEEIPADVDNN